MKKADNPGRLRLILIQISIITPIFLALLVYIKQGIEMNRVKLEYRKLVEIEEELYSQYEDLLLEKEILSSPAKIENIVLREYGFVYPDCISVEKKEEIRLTLMKNEQ